MNESKLLPVRKKRFIQNFADRTQIKRIERISTDKNPFLSIKSVESVSCFYIETNFSLTENVTRTSIIRIHEYTNQRITNHEKTKNEQTMNGIVIRSKGKWYTIRKEDGDLIRCRIRGKLRLNDLKLTNPIAVGDKVSMEKEAGQDTAVITGVLPRHNYVVRQSPRKKHYLHLLCANIDQAIVIATIREPMLKPGFIDRFLMTTTPHDIPTIILVNKMDLWQDEDDEIFGGLRAIYEPLGYPVMAVSALRGDGLDDLRALLKDKITFVCGHSGVGKSTLANGIQPGLELATQEVSGYSQKGKHTTTFAEMHQLEFGGHIIDTPGIKELAFINMKPHDAAHNFVEFFEALQHCKFSNCLHINEPKCAVKAAVETGEISSLRYENYLNIMEDVLHQKHWERNTDW